MKTINSTKSCFLILSLIVITLFSCKKEDYDYRDKWVGDYETTTIEYYFSSIHDNGRTCGDVEWTSYPYWRITRGTKDNELKVKTYDGYTYKDLVFTLQDTLGNFVEITNGVEYEKGHITNRDLYFEKYELNDSTHEFEAKSTKITGFYNSTLIF